MASIETIIKEWQARPLPEFVRRDLRIQLKGNLAAAVIGMRRSGKTWRLFQEMDRLIREGGNPADMLYLNFDDGRLPRENGVELLDEVLETFFRINPASRRRGACFFFDEIQEVPGWARFARRILDTEKIKLFVSGSSAKLLSTEIATEFRGRSLAFELLPFSFREYLRRRRMPEKPSPLERSAYERAFLDYLTEGGFPEALSQEDPYIRTGLLQSYLDAVVLRDVLERYGLSNARGVKELAYTLITHNAQPVSVNRLAHQLQSRNIPMSREMVTQVSAHFEDAFLVFFVPLYTWALQKARVNPQKVYAADPGLAYALSAAASQNAGQRFEQAVYLELRRRYPLLRRGGISYYLTQDRREIDFILGDPAQKAALALIQASLGLKDPETRKRETDSLAAAMRELGLKKAHIITLHEEEKIKTKAGIINVVPAWRWFLEE